MDIFKWIGYLVFTFVIGWAVANRISPELEQFFPIGVWPLRILIVAAFLVLGSTMASGRSAALYFAPLVWGTLFGLKHGLIGFVLGPLVTLGGALLAFRVALFWFSRRISPETMDVSQSKNLIYDKLVQFVSNPPSDVDAEKMVDGVPFSFYELGVGHIENHQCGVVFNGGRFVRQLPPGFAALNGGEEIVQVIDVRPQIRRIKQEFTTRDGLFFSCDIVIKFRIFQPEATEQIDHPQRYPYSPEAIKAFVHGDAVAADGSQRGSYERVVTQVILYLSEEISKKTLDELCSINNPNYVWDEIVLPEVERESREEFEERGIQITDILIESVTLPDKVLDVRRKAWKGKWEKPVKGNKVGGGIGEIKAEDARLQLEVVEEVMASIDKFYDESNLPFRDEIYAKIRYVMADVVAESTLRAIIPAPPAEN